MDLTCRVGFLWTIKFAILVAALLQDVRRLIPASKMPDEFCSALALSSKRKCEPFEAEEEILGTSHAEIGAPLLGLWHIPNQVVKAIAASLSHPHSPVRLRQFDSSLCCRPRWLANWMLTPRI